MEPQSEELPPELQAPDFTLLFRLSFLIPFAAYLAFFRYSSQFVSTHMWKSFTGFKRYRLNNLSICFFHALIEAFNDITHYWSPWVAQVPIMSIAYFVQDALDMAKHEWSRWMVELLIHHSITCVALVSPLVAHRFLLADSWALLMEFNSIFLHARTIMQLTGHSTSHPKTFRVIVYLNLASFMLFRIVCQLIWVFLAFSIKSQMHNFYIMIALCGPIIFAFINGMLFLRLLVSDGFLPAKYQKFFSVNRDAESDREKGKPTIVSNAQVINGIARTVSNNNDGEKAKTQ
ncbi:unnamed protein product [Caenorhabditis auriculariae]|uniref:TLC domain-containing protein n=1 Tax=Caenorhabditis auriculariae TaxID=2777116 RepID=A0A8S1H7P0_9PELO|nr:unnamed protein product [Caenorhabditis auriculariae]